MSTHQNPQDHLYTPVIIIGAPRSGTNLLRDVLSALHDFGTWPCDEINLIWRYGNARHPTDELRPDQATDEVKRFIRRAFERLARRCNLNRIVEKTCANSLRIPFVDQVLPDARFVFIVRDGRDAAASAMRRWRAPFELSYTIKKARFVPVRDIPYYGSRFITNRLRRIVSRDRRVATWGPVFEGLREILQREGLAAACGAQWARCVDAAEKDLAELAPGRVFPLRYEEFVRSPVTHIHQLLSYLEMQASSADIERAAAKVEPHHTGKWKDQLDEAELRAVLVHAAPVLRRHGYVA